MISAARWRALFLIVFVALALAKLAIACTLSPFGDEAFYWQESRRLAWGYSDLPPLTAWLIRFGESVAGHGLIGMRWPFLLLGSALPWLVAAMARDSFGARAGWQAGLLAMALPLAGSLGVLALPDVPLTVAIALACWMLPRALHGNRRGAWWWLGVALAVAWATHYRAAMAILVGLALCVLSPQGRRAWRSPRLWMAMAVATLGLLPLLVSNWQQHGAGLAFQLVERNPWRFHADALAQPMEQALACTPLLYAWLLWAAWRSWRRRGEGTPWDVAAIVGGGFVLLYFALGLFADDTRFRVHWPLPGYLPLLAVLPPLLRTTPRRWRSLFVASVALAGLGLCLGLGYLALAASVDGARGLAGVKAFPSNFVGWRESADTMRRLRAPSDVLVADNFMLAAELAFALDDTAPVYALDSPLNTKHGRAPQLAAWSRDEVALRRARAGAPMLLAVDETALRERERLGWLGGLCGRIDAPRLVARLDLFDGGKRIAFYRGRVPTLDDPSRSSTDCMIWQRAHAAEYGGGER